jgi:hypothetical protein
MRFSSRFDSSSSSDQQEHGKDSSNPSEWNVRFSAPRGQLGILS